MALLTAASPALADFTLNYTGGAFAFGDSAHVGDGILGSLTLAGTPVLNQTYTAGDLVSWSLVTTGDAGFTLSSANGSVLTAFSVVLNGSGAVSYYNFAAEIHPETCELFCDLGQKVLVVTTNGGQLDAGEVQDSNNFSGVDAAYYDPGTWSSASPVPEPASPALLLLGSAAMLGALMRRRGVTRLLSSRD